MYNKWEKKCIHELLSLVTLHIIGSYRKGRSQDPISLSSPASSHNVGPQANHLAFCLSFFTCNMGKIIPAFLTSNKIMGMKMH